MGSSAEIDVKELDMEVLEMEEKVMDALSEGPREKLRQILEKNGEAILQDSDRVEGLLRDHCGSYRKEISALVGALDERVPLELKGSWQTAMTPEAMRARLVQRLEDHRGLNPDVAAWAVDTWSYALGIGLGRRSERLDSVVLQEDSKHKASGLGSAAGAGDFDRARTDAERRAAIDSDRVGGGGAASAGLLASAEQKKKVGFGVAALAAIVIAAVALGHKKPDPTPTPTPTPIVVVTPPVSNTTQTTPAKTQNAPEKKPDVIAPPVVRQPAAITSIAIGTPVEVRLNQAINSDDVTVGQTFDATLATPFVLNGKTVLPVGADATIKVVSVDEGGKLTGQTAMVLTLVELSSGGKLYHVATNNHSILGPKQAVEATKRGGIGGAAGALGGLVIGKFFHHGGAGAAAGAGTGAAVGVATTKPQPAKAKAEELLHFRLTRSLTVGQ